MKKALLRPRTTGTVCEIVLDEQRYYFCGDHVRGRLVIIPSKALKLTGIRLEFYGHIKTFINTRKQDGHYFFRELLPLDIQTGTLKPGQNYNYPFEFHLPKEIDLPSCSETDTNTGGMIEYVIKATTDRPSREAIMTSFHLPVLERLDISKPKMMESGRDKVTWQSQYPEDIIDKDEYHGVDQVDFAASIPHKGYTRGQEIPVTVDIHHFQPYQRPRGLTISLVRSTKILCKEKAYILSPIIVDSIKLDIDIQHTTGQSITKQLLIPRHISPTITLNAVLMQVDYHIEVKANLGDRRQKNIDLSQMRLEIPITIGTLPSPPTPPGLLDPKFVKGVKYVGQETLPKPLQPPSSSLFPSFDFTSIPSALLEISSSNLRGDTFGTPRRYSQMKHQPSWSPPGSVHDTNPLSLTTASTSVPSRATARSSSLLSPTSTIPVYRSDDDDDDNDKQQQQQQQPFHLTLSLGEPFNLFQSSFGGGGATKTLPSVQSVRLSLEEQEEPIAHGGPHDDSTMSISRNSMNHTQPDDDLPLTSFPSSPTPQSTATTSSRDSMDPSHSPATSSRNSMDPIQSGISVPTSPILSPPHSVTTFSRSNSMDNHQPSSSSPLALLPRNHSTKTTTSTSSSSSKSRNSMGPIQSDISAPASPVLPSPPPPPHSIATFSRSSVGGHQTNSSSPLTLTPRNHNTPSIKSSMESIQSGTPTSTSSVLPPPHNATTSSRNSVDHHRDQPSSIPPLTNNPVPESQYDSITTFSRNHTDHILPSKDDLDSPLTPASPASPPCSTTSSGKNSVDHSQPIPSTTIFPPPTSPVPQSTSTSNRSIIDHPPPPSSPPPASQSKATTIDLDTNPTSYRQVPTFSNYQHTANSGEDYKPESTIEGLDEMAQEPIHFDKPHEMIDSDTDSDDDSDDFISILARREKQVDNTDYWQ